MDFFFNFFATGNFWAIASLLSSILMTAILLFTRNHQYPSQRLVFWSRLVLIITMTPYMMLYANWPKSDIFYLAVFTHALFSSMGDIFTFNVSIKRGGDIIAKTRSLGLFFVFPLWFLFDAELTAEYVANPVKAGLVISSIILLTIFTSAFKKKNTNRVAFHTALPEVLSFACAMVLNKFAMMQGDAVSVVFCYIYLKSLLVMPVITMQIRASNKRLFSMKKLLKPSPKLLSTAIACSILLFSSLVFRNTAMISVPNPAYHLVITQLVPVLMVMLYTKERHKNKKDLMYGVLAVCGAIVLLAVV